MRKRCSNPNRRDYQWYGGKGITVDPEWQRRFSAFIEDMLPTYFPGATLDRKDNSKNYCKDNCKWSTINDQQKNRSNVKQHWLKEAEVRELRNKGLTQEAIGKQLNMSQGRVSDILRGVALK